MVTLDQKIQFLEALFLNSRIHTNELAQRIGLSRQTVSKFLKFLWNSGVIHSPAILINPHVLNLQYSFMEIKTNPSEQDLLDNISHFKEIVNLDGILGDYSLILKVEVQTKRQFAELLNQIDQRIAKTFSSSYRIIECIDVYKIGGFIFSKQYPSKPFDENDKKWEILQLLKKNYNIHRWAERSEFPLLTDKEVEFLSKINLSREFIKFTEDHIISKFTLTYNPRKMVQFLMKSDRCLYEHDFSTKFYLQIKPQRIADYVTLANNLVHHPNIIDLYRTGNEAGLMAIVRTRNLTEYNEFIKDLYHKFPIRDTHTTVVVDELLPSIFPPTKRIAESLSQ
ncbi:Lrp/AsnC family transcriptional regulator [Candidatus Harpocratesius sp.]